MVAGLDVNSNELIFRMLVYDFPQLFGQMFKLALYEVSSKTPLSREILLISMYALSEIRLRKHTDEKEI
jgi:hypothetical protein